MKVETVSHMDEILQNLNEHLELLVQARTKKRGIKRDKHQSLIKQRLETYQSIQLPVEPLDFMAKMAIIRKLEDQTFSTYKNIVAQRSKKNPQE